MHATDPEGVMLDETRSLSSSEHVRARITHDPGARLGRYLVMEEIGRGGMGIVLRAYDPRLQREVALKRVRAQTLSSEAHERMLREAQAMAKLSHPNVVAIYDVEVLGGDVVMTMEYVRGTTLGAWLASEKKKRPWQDILAAFTEAGRGLAAAHAAGVLHRDFKPANVLVGDDGRVRVTDFGIARFQAHGTSRPSSSVREILVEEPSELTQVGDVLGTPRYMAPEQHAGQEIGPAADQYAYCVALFESLTGTRAFVGTEEELAMHKRRGAPRWPADGASRLADAIPARIVAAIERGLAPEPSNRWPSIDALLAALSSEGARPLPWAFAAGMACVVVASGVAWSAWRTDRAQQCTGGQTQIEAVWNAQRRVELDVAMRRTGVPEAGEVAHEVISALDDYVGSWTSAHRDACEASAVRGEQPAEIMDLRMACLHRAKVQLASAGELLAHADAKTVEHAGDVVAGLPPLQRCSDLEALQAEVAPPNEADAEAVEAVRVQLAEAKVLHDAGKLREAVQMLEEVEPRAHAIDYPPLHIETTLLTGLVHKGLGQLAKAHAAYRRALIDALRSRQRNEARQASTALLRTVGSGQGRVREAMAYVPVAMGLSEKGGLEEAILRQDLGAFFRRENALDAAEREYRAAIELFERIGAPAGNALIVKGNLASIYADTGRLREAEPIEREVLESLERLHGRAHPATIIARINRGATLDLLERDDEAEALLRDNLELAQQALGASHPSVGWTLNYLGQLLATQKRYDEAQQVLTRAIAVWEQTNALPELAAAHAGMGDVALARGHREEAGAQYRRALELRLDVFGPEHPSVKEVREVLARAQLTESSDEARDHGTRTRP